MCVHTCFYVYVCVITIFNKIQVNNLINVISNSSLVIFIEEKEEEFLKPLTVSNTGFNFCDKH